MMNNIKFFQLHFYSKGSPAKKKLENISSTSNLPKKEMKSNLWVGFVPLGYPESSVS